MANQPPESRPDDDSKPANLPLTVPPTTPRDSGKRMSASSTPSWQRPDGVTAGNWDYVRSKEIAGKYGLFLENDPLTEADGKVLFRYLPQIKEDDFPARSHDVAERVNDVADEVHRRPLVADFGCGNGRSLFPLMARGYDGLGVDLSLPMLQVFFDKYARQVTETSSPPLNSTDANLGKLYLLQANLVHLDAMETDSIDHALCLFSTLGMIEGRANRRKFLLHVRRVLRPGGKFIVHAHNVFFQLRAPGGMRWFAGSLWDTWRGKQELGDRTAGYRGLKNLFIHSYRRSELIADLSSADFQSKHWHAVMPGENDLADTLPMFSALRVVGWVAVCE